MHPFRIAPLVALAIAALVRSSPATDTTPAPSPTTAPAEVRAVLKSFMEAMLDKGDEKTTFDLVYFPNEESRKEAKVIWGAGLLTRQLELAIEVAMSKQPTPQEDPVMQQMIADNLAKSVLTIAGDRAAFTHEVKFTRKGSYTYALVRDQNTWKIDYERTQRPDEGPYDKDAVAIIAAKNQITLNLIGEVKNHKYPNMSTVYDELEKRNAPPSFPSARAAAGDKNGRNAAIADIARLRAILNFFDIDNHFYPTTAEGLDLLVHVPRSLLNTWAGPYLANMPTDPWGHPYIYHSPGAAASRSFDLTSNGPDGLAGTADDITLDTSE